MAVAKENTVEMKAVIDGFKKFQKDLSSMADTIGNMFDPQTFNKQINNMTSSISKGTEKQIGYIDDAVGANRQLYSSQRMINDALGDYTAEIEQASNQKKDFIDHVRASLPQLGMLHYGLLNIVRTSHEFNQESKDWYRELNAMTDASGDATLAISQMHTVFGMSAGSLGTIRSTMSSLVAQGIPNTSQGFEQLTTNVINLAQSTGISAESFSTFSGILIRNWGASAEAANNMMSSVIALQRTFSMTSAEVDTAMKTIGEAIEQLGPFLDNAAKGADTLTKGIGQAIGVMTEFGVSTQRASEFVSGLIDPSKIGENLALLQRLGISYQDYMDMLASGDAEGQIFDELMTNLPEVSRQIQNIADPMARMNFAQSLGLPLEIAQKMAKATTGEIQSLMKDYKEQAKADEAAIKRQEKMEEESAKFNETLHLMKRDTLEPMMNWVNDNIKYFWQAMETFQKFYRMYISSLTTLFDRVRDVFLPLFEVIEGEKTFGDFMGKVATGVMDIIKDIVLWGVKIIVDNFWNILGEITSNVRDFFTQLWDWNRAFAAGVAAFIGIKGIQSMLNFWKSFQGTTPLNPMFVSDVSRGIARGAGGVAKGANVATTVARTAQAPQTIAIERGVSAALDKSTLFTSGPIGKFFNSITTWGGRITQFLVRLPMMLMKTLGGVLMKVGTVLFKGLFFFFSKLFLPITIALGTVFGAYKGIQELVRRREGGHYDQEVEKGIEKYGKVLEEGGKLTKEEMDEYNKNLRRSNDDLKDVLDGEAHIRMRHLQTLEKDQMTEDQLRRKEVLDRRNQAEEEYNKLYDNYSEGLEKFQEENIGATSLDFDQYQRELLRKRRNLQEELKLAGEGRSGVGVLGERYAAGGDIHGFQSSLLQDMGIEQYELEGMGISGKAITHETKEAIFNEADELMRMWGYGLTEQQEKQHNKNLQLMEDYKNEEVDLNANQLKRLQEQIAHGNKLKSKEIDAHKFFQFQREKQIREEMKQYEEGTKEHEKLVKKLRMSNSEYADAANNFDDINNALVTTMGLTLSGLQGQVEDATMFLDQQYNSFTAMVSGWASKWTGGVRAQIKDANEAIQNELMPNIIDAQSISDDDEFEKKIKQINKERSKHLGSLLDASDLRAMGSIEDGNYELARKLHAGEEFDDDQRKMLESVIKIAKTTDEERIRERREERLKIERANEENQKKLGMIADRTGRGAQYTKDLRDQGRDKDPRTSRQEWIASMVGLQHSYVIKDSFS